jgi:undecaprenyl-diphosphatase
MTFFDALWLGIVQALTEFLPVSSSGHLVVLQHLFGLTEPMLAFDVVLHVGSLVAVVVFYRRRLWRLVVSIFQPSHAPGGRHLILMILLASIPAAVVGVGLEALFEELFSSPSAVAVFWLLTAGLLFGASRVSEGRKSADDVTASDALLIGLFQAVAILPGVSRSGATIVAAILCGLRAKEAADFSFLIYIPAILGATVLKLGDLSGTAHSELVVYGFGAVVAAVVSYGAISLLLRLLQRRVIQPFAWYCLGASALTLLVTVLRP